MFIEVYISKLGELWHISKNNKRTSLRSLGTVLSSVEQQKTECEILKYCSGTNLLWWCKKAENALISQNYVIFLLFCLSQSVSFKFGIWCPSLSLGPDPFILQPCFIQSFYFSFDTPRLTLPTFIHLKNIEDIPMFSSLKETF